MNRITSRFRLPKAVVMMALILVASATTAHAFVMVDADLTKEFCGGPAEPGDTVMLMFTLTNLSDAESLNSLSFSDDLDAVLPGLVAIDTPRDDVVGAGSLLSGTDFLTLSGGALAPGEQACFLVTVQVPLTAAPGEYLNTTSDLFDEGVSIAPPATDTLVVIPEPATMSLLLAGIGTLALRRRK